MTVFLARIRLARALLRSLQAGPAIQRVLEQRMERAGRAPEHIADVCAELKILARDRLVRAHRCADCAPGRHCTVYALTDVGRRQLRARGTR